MREADIFAGANATLFALMCLFVYHDRFVQYRGPANVGEFFVYALAIFSVILVIWWFLRRLDYPAWLLILVEIGILAHFAGAFVPIDGGRLYDTSLLGVRYDKFVHGGNAFAGAALIDHVLGRLGARLPGRALVVVGLVMGAGAVVEILEYLVATTVPGARDGVGTYDNNMQDLVANAIGAALFSGGILPLVRLAGAARGR